MHKAQTMRITKKITYRSVYLIQIREKGGKEWADFSTERGPGGVGELKERIARMRTLPYPAEYQLVGRIMIEEVLDDSLPGENKDETYTDFVI